MPGLSIKTTGAKVLFAGTAARVLSGVALLPLKHPVHQPAYRKAGVKKTYHVPIKCLEE